MKSFDNSIFKMDFTSTDDENDVFEFPNESFDLDWDAEPPSFEQNPVHPLSSRMSTSKNSNLFHNHTPGKNSSVESLTSPRIITDSVPFRGKYSRAALASHRLNTDSQLEHSFRSEDEEFGPKKLFTSGISEPSSGPLSPNVENNESYFSFGDQSVFSDVTESVMSGNTPASSPFRDFKGKEGHSRLKQHTIGAKPLFRVHEDGEEHSRSSAILASNENYLTRGKDTSRYEFESDAEKRMSSRLATFFANRSLTRSKKVLPEGEEQFVQQGEGPEMNATKRQSNRTTPPGSTSGSSTGYVGWPGTLDKNGCTVAENSSYSTAEFSNSKKSSVAIDQSSDDIAMFWMQQKSHDKHVTERNEHTSSETEILQDCQEEKPTFSTVARARVADLKRRFEQRHMAKEKSVHDDPMKSGKQPSSKLKSNSNEMVNSASDRERSNFKVNGQRLNRSHELMIPEDESVDLEHNDMNKTFPGAGSRDLMERTGPKIDTTGSLKRMELAGKRLLDLSRFKTTEQEHDSSSPVRLSEAALRQKELLTSSFQTIAHGANVKGFRGFIDKTADIPNLMDDAESVTSASTIALFRRKEHADTESDVFDGVGSVYSAGTPQKSLTQSNSTMNGNDQSHRINLLSLNYGISSVQTTSEVFDKGMTSTEFDVGLSESDTDHATKKRVGREHDRAILPGHYDVVSVQGSEYDDESVSCSSSRQSGQGNYSLVAYDLSKFAVSSSQVRKLVKAYRSMSQFVNSGIISEQEEDAKKAFALFEMRSRIMQTDIERGFDRTGGTITVDDLVLTRYFNACCRVRDAVIVSKAWRDGATPQDARTALALTEDRDFYVTRTIYITNPTQSFSSDQESIASSSSRFQYSYERVGWIDDTEFSLIKCFGSKMLRGVDIFTVGDCQSMLLKLTHEHYETLREELKDASSRLLVAEQMLKDEGCHSSSMTEAEIEYLEIMEEVKTLSANLKKAERAFNLVKSEIEDLVQQYEDILEQIDNDNSSSSSYDTEDKTDIEDNHSDSSDDSYYDKERLARRVQRAELKAEVAAREAQLAKIEVEKTKQEAERIRVEKEKELKQLKQKLEDLEAKSAIMASDFEAKLTSQTLVAGVTEGKRVSFDTGSSYGSATDPKSMLYAASTVGTDPDQNETKARVKAKFRQRRSQMNTNRDIQAEKHAESNNHQLANKQRLTGQVHQRLEFYERSLQSIQATTSKR